jgi:DNA-binding SARP family transcriptional activator
MKGDQHLRLCLLGGFQLLVNSEAVLVPMQAQRLLGFLALRAVETRATVAGTLWGDSPGPRAAANLRNTVWRIRLASDSLLHCGRQAIGLGPTVALDLHDARRWAQELLDGSSPDSPAGMIDVLDRDLLPTWDEDWLLIERERQRQLRLHALEALSDRLSSAGRHPEAVAAALAAVGAEPLRESAQRTLIHAHLAERNVSEAVRQFESYRRLLDAELAIAPSAELARLLYDTVRMRTVG